ncbi:MAG: hypothetical protein V3T03_06450, partial [Candidatus Bipolaricaulota bacterium]
MQARAYNRFRGEKRAFAPYLQKALLAIQVAALRVGVNITNTCGKPLATGGHGYVKILSIAYQEGRDAPFPKPISFTCADFSRAFSYRYFVSG